MVLKCQHSLCFCHPGRRPGIQCAPLPIAIVGSAQGIPDQVRDDKKPQIRLDIFKLHWADQEESNGQFRFRWAV